MSARGARLEYQQSIDLRQEHWAATQATNYLDFMADLSIDRDPRTIRNSGLICTIGNSFKVEVSPKSYFIFNAFIAYGGCVPRNMGAGSADP